LIYRAARTSFLRKQPTTALSYLPALRQTSKRKEFQSQLDSIQAALNEAQAQKAAIQATIDDLQAQKTDIKKIVDTL